MLNEQLTYEIQGAYEASGNELGWRLLSSPASTLRSAEVAFIGLNPGGSQAEPDHDGLCMPEGFSAYVDEVWGAGKYARGQAPLQKQMRALFERLGVAPHEVLAGNLIPFRSPDLKSLINKDSSITFGSDLWSEILGKASPGMVVCIGGSGREAVDKNSWR